MSETASFVDPVFLARFGLSRLNALDYFLHPLNPFRTSATTSNEILAMQGIGIGTLMQQGMIQHGVLVALSPESAELEYATALTRLTGEQYELLPPPDRNYTAPSPLYSIRHVIRSNPTTTKVLGIYTIVEGAIYKAPSVRALMKTHVARTLQGLSDACSALSECARYQPSTGYTWKFEPDDYDEDGDDDDDDNDDHHLGKEDPVVALLRLAKRNKRRKILDTRPAGERSAAEEEGIRATEAMDQILVRLSKSNVVVVAKKGNLSTTTTTTTNKPMKMTTITTAVAAAATPSTKSSTNESNN